MESFTKADKRTKDVLVAINDAPSDGMDISWIWDVDFEKLAEADTLTVSASGVRKHDTALRLKYAGFNDVKTIDITAETLRSIAEGKGEVCYLLVNYTVLFGKCRQIVAVALLILKFDLLGNA